MQKYVNKNFIASSSVSKAQSCSQKIQEDFINSCNQAQKNIRIVKSAEECKKEDLTWEKIEQKDRKEYKDQIKDCLGIKKHLKLKEGGAYASEVLSEEVSIEDSINSQRNNQKVRGNKDSVIIQLEHKNKSVQKSMVFNIMVGGSANVGKSTFIESFLSKDYEKQPIIRQRTQKLTQHQWKRQVNSLQLHIKLLDIPGYYDSQVKQYITFLQKIFMQRMKRYQQHPNIKDQRVHCCLFFLKGPRVESNDWKIMKAIQKYVNIIPVISKGDTYTINEIKDFKRRVLEKQFNNQVRWFDGEEYIRQNYPEQLKNLTGSIFGRVPPFVVAGCAEYVRTESGHLEYGRLYKWGQCQLENQNHTDYLLLKKFIITYFSQQLIQYTDAIQKTLMNSKQKYSYSKSKLSKKPLSLLFGMGLLLGFASFAIIINKNSIRK